MFPGRSPMPCGRRPYCARTCSAWSVLQSARRGWTAQYACGETAFSRDRCRTGQFSNWGGAILIDGDQAWCPPVFGSTRKTGTIGGKRGGEQYRNPAGKTSRGGQRNGRSDSGSPGTTVVGRIRRWEKRALECAGLGNGQRGPEQPGAPHIFEEGQR
jgi:hypothetical protein